MTTQIRSLSVPLLGVWALLIPSQALGVVRNDDTRGDTSLFPFAVKVGDASEFYASGTVIGNGRFVITAGHALVGTDAGAYRVMLDGGATLSGVGTVAVHPFLDLAIIPLAGAFTQSVSVYSDFDEVGRVISFAGYGRSSDAEGGGGPGTGMAELLYGTLRAGSNVVDLLDEPTHLLGFDFDLAGGVGTGGLGDAEATTFFGDSGMGYVTEVAPGEFSLLGVHLGIFTPPPLNRDQVISFGVRLSTVRDWVMVNIPAPGAAALGALALAGAARRRRVAQN